MYLCLSYVSFFLSLLASLKGVTYRLCTLSISLQFSIEQLFYYFFLIIKWVINLFIYLFLTGIFIIFFNFILFLKFYKIVLVMPNIIMNPPQVYSCFRYAVANYPYSSISTKIMYW